uniref:Uncharacterized protein n=1 Tax=Anguilla anguilla TaxID=7936 RepID=A0A0E9QGH6_ANGAN
MCNLKITFNASVVYV